MCVLKVNMVVTRVKVDSNSGLLDRMKSGVCQGDGQSDEPRRKELPPHDALPASLLNTLLTKT